MSADASTMLNQPLKTANRNVLLVLMLIGMATLAMADTWAAMMHVWRNSETFTHGFVVLPVTAWLIWQRRKELAALPMVPFWPALLALLGCSLLWIVGRLGGVAAAQQFAAVGAIPSLIALVFGWRIAAMIAFPLGFLLFAVPFGTFLLPIFIDWTAVFTVHAVRLSGIPIFQEGVNFALPSGRWSVVESCSGLRYLLAALPLACIYAYLSYRSAKTRLIFILATIAISIVANWVRAYLIVMLGHFSNMTIAVGADHLVYGWLFFGIVMALSFWAGSFLRDSPPSPNDGQTSAIGGASVADARFSRHALAMAAGLIFMLSWGTLANRLLDVGAESFSLAPLNASLVRTAPQADAYTPLYAGAVETASGQSKADPNVQVFVGRYFRQHRTAEMITDGNRNHPGSPDETIWQVRRTQSVRPESLGASFPKGMINEHVIEGPSGRYLTWEWFVVNDHVFNRTANVKLQTALDVLKGRGDESMVWFVWTPMPDGPEQARARLVAEANRLGAIGLGKTK